MYFYASSKPEMSPHPTVNIAQYGDPHIRYAGDKQGQVTQILMFIRLNNLFLVEYFLNRL